MDHWRYLFLFQEFGDVNTNNLGHTVTMTVHPLTKRKVKAVFMPKKPEGVWSGEIVESSMVQAETLIDDDVSALRKNQLCLDWIELNRPDRCDIDCQCQSQMLCCVFCLWVIASATAAATEGNKSGAGLSAPAICRVFVNQWQWIYSHSHTVYRGIVGSMV